MPDNFIFRRAGRVDLPGIRQLFIDANFLSSGPPDELNEYDIHWWLSDHVSFPIVVYPAAEAGRVIGHIQMCRKVTGSRASRADLEDVCVHPDFLGRGLGFGLLARGIWQVQHSWRARRVEWFSENTTHRAQARKRYRELGAKLVHGTDSCYRLDLPYTPPPHIAPHFKSV